MQIRTHEIRYNVIISCFYTYFCRKFENIYVGWGLKYSAENYSPPIPPPTQEEYPSGPEVTEAEDPTVEAERALKVAQQEAQEQEEEEEESEEYDDDE